MPVAGWKRRVKERRGYRHAPPSPPPAPDCGSDRQPHLASAISASSLWRERAGGRKAAGLPVPVDQVTRATASLLTVVSRAIRYSARSIQVLPAAAITSPALAGDHQRLLRMPAHARVARREHVAVGNGGASCPRAGRFARITRPSRRCEDARRHGSGAASPPAPRSAVDGIVRRHENSGTHTTAGAGGSSSAPSGTSRTPLPPPAARRRRSARAARTRRAGHAVGDHGPVAAAAGNRSNMP